MKSWIVLDYYAHTLKPEHTPNIQHFRNYIHNAIQTKFTKTNSVNVVDPVKYDIDKDTWTYETEGKVFHYYNPFNCPHCGTPYIDYKKHPENKVFGVSGCVLLGKKHYQAQ